MSYIHYSISLLVILTCLLQLQARSMSPVKRVNSGRRSGFKTVPEGEDCLCMDNRIECVGRDILSYRSNFHCNQSTTHVIITETKINTLPRDAFSNHSHIELIAIYKNNLTTLPKEIFSGLTHLKKIVIMEDIEVPDGIFLGLQNLEEVILVSHGTRELPPRLFAGLRSLRKVSLFENNLTSLPSNTFTGISSLQELDLSKNQLRSIPNGLFRDLKSINSLVMNHNLLTSITARDLQGIQFVERLDLEFNNIAELPTYDNKWPTIRHIYLTGNRNMNVRGTALRSWLNGGSVDVEVVLHYVRSKEKYIRVRPSELVSLVRDRKVKTEVGFDCDCGSVTLDKARVYMCVDTECGAGKVFNNWVQAVEAAANGGARASHSSHSKDLRAGRNRKSLK